MPVGRVHAPGGARVQAQQQRRQRQAEIAAASPPVGHRLHVVLGLAPARRRIDLGAARASAESPHPQRQHQAEVEHRPSIGGAPDQRDQVQIAVAGVQLVEGVLRPERRGHAHPERTGVAVADGTVAQRTERARRDHVAVAELVARDDRLPAQRGVDLGRLDAGQAAQLLGRRGQLQLAPGVERAGRGLAAFLVVTDCVYTLFGARAGDPGAHEQVGQQLGRRHHRSAVLHETEQRIGVGGWQRRRREDPQHDVRIAVAVQLEAAPARDREVALLQQQE